MCSLLRPWHHFNPPLTHPSPCSPHDEEERKEREVSVFNLEGSRMREILYGIWVTVCLTGWRNTHTRAHCPPAGLFVCSFCKRLFLCCVGSTIVLIHQAVWYKSTPSQCYSWVLNQGLSVNLFPIRIPPEVALRLLFICTVRQYHTHYLTKKNHVSTKKKKSMWAQECDTNAFWKAHPTTGGHLLGCHNSLYSAGKAFHEISEPGCQDQFP